MEEINPIGLALDVSGACEGIVGEHGLGKKDLEALVPRIKDILDILAGEREIGSLDFYGLPSDKDVLANSMTLASSIGGRFDNLVVLGIGGSSLGPRALVRCLRTPFMNLKPPEKRSRRPRVFFLDNLDPDTFSDLLEILPLSRTAFNVVSKSGSTVETLAQFLAVRERLELLLGPNASEHIIVTTDPENGPLREIAEKRGYHTLDIPPAVGGRYSVLSPVGLFPAAVAGADVELLVQGAAEMEELCWRDDIWSNPAAMLASVLYLLDRDKGCGTHVFMAYSDALESVCKWQRQLWAESLGKSSKGPTPCAAVGTPDQHSMLQLYLDGPRDKAVVFITSRSFDNEVEVPLFSDAPLFDDLAEKSFSRILSAEQRATELALADAKKPTLRIELPSVSPRPLGALLMLLEAATALAGGLYGVNPFDQPGVERIKQYTWGILGREGFSEFGGKAEAAPGPQPWQRVEV